MKFSRPAAVGVLTALSAMCLAGCNTSALTKQEAVVYFAPNASEAEHVAALKACSNISPEVVPEPISTSSLASDDVGNVRFRIDHANDLELAHLTECLARQPGVKGWDIPDLTD